jgi:hypothetical protein
MRILLLPVLARAEIVDRDKGLGFNNFPICRQMSRVFGLDLRKLFNS